MKRLMNLEQECLYIQKTYGRWESDITTTGTCADILHWLEVREQFNNLIYAGNCKCDGQNYGSKLNEKEKIELRERLFADQHIKHRRKTLDRCLNLLLKDLYVIKDD